MPPAVMTMERRNRPQVHVRAGTKWSAVELESPLRLRARLRAWRGARLDADLREKKEAAGRVYRQRNRRRELGIIGELAFDDDTVSDAPAAAAADDDEVWVGSCWWVGGLAGWLV